MQRSTEHLPLEVKSDPLLYHFPFITMDSTNLTWKQSLLITIFALVVLPVGCTYVLTREDAEPAPSIEQTTQQKEPDVRNGMSESERRTIFDTLVSAERKARSDADSRFPLTTPENIDQNSELNQELTQEYKANVREQYGITEDVQIKIEVEGVQKGWLLP